MKSFASIRLPCARWRPSSIGRAIVFLALTWLAHESRQGMAAGRIRGAPVVFSRPGGTFTNAFPLTLEAKSRTASVRFTTDGSEPGPASPPYGAPISITNSVVIRARLFEKSAPVGDAVSQSYVLLAPDLWDFTSNLPLFLVNTFGTEITRDAKIPASLRVLGPDSGPGRAAVNGIADFDGRMLINLRGRASLRYPKRSYTVKLLADTDEFLSAPLLGLPKDPDWVLYAPYPDKTLMRDVLAYELSNNIGRWAPRTRFVELFLSEGDKPLGRENYLGVYVLEERVKRGSSRVDLEKLGPDDNSLPEITGGYIFKKDHSDRGGGPTFIQGYPPFEAASSSSKNGFPTGPGGFPGDPAGFSPTYTGRSSSSSSSSSSRSSKSSRPAIVTNIIGAPVQAKRVSTSSRTVYIGDEGEELVMGEDEDISLSESFKTTVLTNRFYFVEPEPDEITGAQRGWLMRHLDEVESTLASRDFKDPDKGYARYIDVESFIDYHLLVETTKNVDGFRFSTFYYKDRGGKIKMGPLWDWNLSFGNCNGKQGYMPEYWLWPQLDNREYAWFRRLFEDRDFGQRYVDRWAELRRTVYATSNILQRVDAIAAQLDEAQKRNYERWPILGITVNPNWFVSDTYAGEVKWLKEWISSRLAWIDAQFVASPKPAREAEARVSLEAKGAEIYFTTDGSDPRLHDGDVSSNATQYTGPALVPAGKTLFARARRNNRWSAPVIVRD